jgi:hypothetical protein
MTSLLWLPLTALLVFGCKESRNEVTAPMADAPNGGVVDLDNIAANVAAQVGIAARCVQLRYISETGVVRSKQRGSGCLCQSGRPVSVTAVIWSGAWSNNTIGRADCGGYFVAGPTTAVDPGGGAFGIASAASMQLSGGPSCHLTSSVNSTRDRSNRLVICVFH